MLFPRFVLFLAAAAITMPALTLAAAPSQEASGERSCTPAGLEEAEESHTLVQNVVHKRKIQALMEEDDDGLPAAPLDAAAEAVRAPVRRSARKGAVAKRR